MLNQNNLTFFRGNLPGAFTATLIALPESIAFGTLLMAPLGATFIPIGVAAGIASLAIVNLVSVFYNRESIIIHSPYSLTTLMLSATVGQISHLITKYNSLAAPDHLTILFLVVLLSGIFQMLLGLLRVGDAAKYIPYPVVSGLINGTSILIIIDQIPVLLGLPDSVSLGQLWNHMDMINTNCLFLGLCTALTVIVTDKWIKKVPAPFMGLVMGSAMYWIMTTFGPKYEPGEIIGSIPFQIPEPVYLFRFAEVFERIPLGHILSIIIEMSYLAFSIALVASLRSLITVVTVDNITGRRTSSNRELIYNGLNNTILSFFGGLVCTGSTTITTGSYKYGGKSVLARFFTGMFALSVLLFLNNYVAFLPKVVLASILLVLAILFADFWLIELIVDSIRSRQIDRRENGINALLVILVASVMVIVGIFEAVAVGIAMSFVMFVMRMSKDVVRRELSGAKIRSNIERPSREIHLLEKLGDRIRILELEGSLFFATTDKITEIVYNLKEGDIQYIILDFKRVTEIDSTGQIILRDLHMRCREDNKYLLFSSFDTKNIRYRSLSGQSYSFDELEDALAWCEDMIIDQYTDREDKDTEIRLRDIDALTHMTNFELQTLRAYLKKERYQNGEYVFRAGDTGDRVFFVLQGRAQILVHLPGNIRKRVSTLSPGTIFGEMSLIDGGPRSADVMAEDTLVCYMLHKQKLSELHDRNPQIAYKIMVGVGKELSKRIRIINTIVTQLKN